jgi:hypothetical protein
MRKDRDWVAGARLQFGGSSFSDSRTQESYIFSICRSLYDNNVQVFDLKPEFVMAALFEVKSPTKRAAYEKARDAIEKTISPYAGNLILTQLNIVPLDKVSAMMLETRSSTWPEISRKLPEEVNVSIDQSIANEPLLNEGLLEDVGDEHLAEVIPLFPNRQLAARLSHPAHQRPRQPAEIVSLFSTVRRNGS